MTNRVLCVITVILSSRLASPQTPEAPSIRDVIAATLADLHGRNETIDTTRSEDWADGSVLWFSLLGPPFAGNPNAAGPMVGTPIVSVPPPRNHSSPGTVSARRLRHRAPKAARNAYEKAGKLSRKKDFENAAKELETAITLDADFAEAHCDLGVAYTHLHRYPEAAAEFRRTMELVPDESIPASDLAWVLFAVGQRAEAEVNVRRALRISPDNASAHLLFGCLLIDTPETFADGVAHLEYAGRTLPEAQRLAKALKRK